MSLFDDVTDAIDDIIDDVLEDVLDGIGDAIDGLTQGAEGFLSQLAKLEKELFSKLGLGEKGAAGYLLDLVKKSGGEATINDVADSFVTSGDFDKPDPNNPDNLTPREQYESAMKSGDKESATRVVSNYSSTPSSAIRAVLDKTTPTAAGKILVDASTLSLPPSYDIGENFGTDNPKFTYVSTREELEAEMRAIPRPISEVVVHWTETHTNSNLDADQIQQLNIATGSNKIAYHYIIKRDGSLQRGLPVSELGEHCETLNHNQYSIGVVFVGGINVSTGTPQTDEFTQAASITRSQFNTFYEFVKLFYDVYPGGQVLGHRDIDTEQEDPGFDVIDYCEANFGKISVYEDPTKEQAMSPSEIIAKQIDNSALVSVSETLLPEALDTIT